MTGSTWRDRAPAYLTDSGGDPWPTPLDGRWLWRLEGTLGGGHA